MTEALPIVSVAISIDKLTGSPSITLPWNPFILHVGISDDTPEINTDFRDLPPFIDFIENLAGTAEAAALLPIYIEAKSRLTGTNANMIATTGHGLDWVGIQTQIHDQASAELNALFGELRPRLLSLRAERSDTVAPISEEDFQTRRAQLMDHFSTEASAIMRNGQILLNVAYELHSSGQMDFGEITEIFTGQCFPAGTLISMANGTQRRIEDIRAGDIVLSFDPATGDHLPRAVTKLYRGETEVWINLTYTQNGVMKSLASTPEHPFLTVDGQCAPISQLINAEGLVDLVLADGSIVQASAQRVQYSAQTAGQYQQAYAYASAGGRAKRRHESFLRRASCHPTPTAPSTLHPLRRNPFGLCICSSTRP